LAKKLEKRVSLKMSDDLLEDLERLADYERRSLSNMILVLVEEALIARNLRLAPEPPDPIVKK
jgi:hypothetical protein